MKSQIRIFEENKKNQWAFRKVKRVLILKDKNLEKILQIIIYLNKINKNEVFISSINLFVLKVIILIDIWH